MHANRLSVYMNALLAALNMRASLRVRGEVSEVTPLSTPTDYQRRMHPQSLAIQVDTTHDKSVDFTTASSIDHDQLLPCGTYRCYRVRKMFISALVKILSKVK
jgi:hypothetical protein